MNFSTVTSHDATQAVEGQAAGGPRQAQERHGHGVDSTTSPHSTKQCSSYMQVIHFFEFEIINIPFKL